LKVPSISTKVIERAHIPHYIPQCSTLWSIPISSITRDSAALFRLTFEDAPFPSSAEQLKPRRSQLCCGCCGYGAAFLDQAIGCFDERSRPQGPREHSCALRLERRERQRPLTAAYRGRIFPQRQDPGACTFLYLGVQGDRFSQRVNNWGCSEPTTYAAA